MRVLDIITYPDERLRQVAKPVENFDSALVKTVSLMLETMYEKDVVGLAAPQVGIFRQIIVLDASEFEDQPEVLINPVIVDASDEVIFEESCLSVPDVYEKIKRFNHLVIEAADETGAVRKMEAYGVKAACIQHELDLLNGILLVDRLSSAKKNRLQNKLQNKWIHGMKPKTTMGEFLR